ncbi:sugar O-acetyltransferase [Glaciecola sp. 1036]|uniref:sugar O-acetyltransferase n=1 Tax=Alteromonadaceae TaxID=72275 RepID=UPI003D058EBD
MTELQKMLNQEPYFATDKELSELRLKAKQLCFEFNQTAPKETKTKKGILKKLLPNAKGFWAEAPFNCDYGSNIYCQGNVFVNHNVTILDGARVEIGKSCFIGPNVVIACTSHAKEIEQRRKGVCKSLPVSIGDDVWIGAGAIILGGVSIPSGSVIPAGQTVR